MTVAYGECEAAVAALRSDPLLAGLLRPEAACLLWDRDGVRLLWASQAAAALAAACTDAEGRADPHSPIAGLLHALAAGRAPRDGVRLERVRLDANSLRPPTTFACRVVTLDGGEGLLTCVVGAMPSLRSGPRPVRAAEPRAVPVRQDAGPDRVRPGAVPAEPAKRFLWQTDNEGRFTLISEPFQAMLDTADTGVIGRTWDELEGEITADPDGAVAAGFSSRQAWSHARSRWQLPDQKILPVTMAGSPAGDASAFEGFRGFGRFRLGEIEPGSLRHAPAGPSEPSLNDAASAGPAGVPEGAGGVTAGPSGTAPQAASAEPIASAIEPAGPEPDPAPMPAPAGVEREPDRAAVLAAPYKTTIPLQPMFQVLLDASLSGLSKFIGAMPPAPAHETHAGGPAPDHADATPADEPAAAAPTDEPVAPVEPAATPEQDPGPQQPSIEPSPSPVTFAGLHTQVAAEFGPPPVPLRLAEPATGEAGPSHRAASSPERAVDAQPVLSFAERGAFHEIARVLGARLEPELTPRSEPMRESADVIHLQQPRGEADARRILDQLPVGVLVFRGETLLFANGRLLELAGYPDPASLMAAGGVSALLVGGSEALRQPPRDESRPVLVTRAGGTVPVQLHRSETEWRDSPASLALVLPRAEDAAAQQVRALECELDSGSRQLDETRAVLDLAADAIVMLDPAGRILSLSGSGEKLFGYRQGEIAGEGIAVLLAPESHAAALAGLDAVRRRQPGQAPSELTGRTRRGEPLTLEVSFGQAGSAHDAPICIIMRDEPRLRQAESDLARAKRSSGKANRQAASFLGRISHEIRTPLNAIIGFAEVMMEERFGPIGTNRYKSYLADIRESGTQVIKLVDDLTDLANAITGRFEISEDGIDLNQAVVDTVAALQPAAARARIVVRTSFASGLPRLFVDARSIRQVVDNILSNAIAFTEAGGQVIASTALSDRGEIALRIRDTGIGMSPDEIEAALEPFREPTALRPEGRSLGLPLAKALVEANRGSLAISSRPREGTLVEVLFPAAVARSAAAAREEAARRRNA